MKKTPQTQQKVKPPNYAHSLEVHVVTSTIFSPLPFLPCVSYILYGNLYSIKLLAHCSEECFLPC